MNFRITCPTCDFEIQTFSDLDGMPNEDWIPEKACEHILLTGDYVIQSTEGYDYEEDILIDD